MSSRIILLEKQEGSVCSVYAPHWMKKMHSYWFFIGDYFISQSFLLFLLVNYHSPFNVLSSKFISKRLR